MTPLNDLRRGTEGRDAMMFGRIKEEEEVQRGRNGEAGRTAGRRKWWLIMRPGCCLASRDAGRPAGRPRLDCARHRSTLTARPAVSPLTARRKPHAYSEIMVRVMLTLACSLTFSARMLVACLLTAHQHAP